ncbi:MAG: bifunctional 5,10-methylenetetrahydrofolate dehydrogenase/5,10-methenyltetrahydrofolate cyclohydrolase [Chloroflexi bacterium]|nr:bifunctional 5,10-methylenetetrahydrofolate dehydrogenase/5,10-methenyltetrahydrofolate cyclohydrolase [Chloroflexota bacterium]
MTAQILAGKPVVDKIAAELRPKIEQFRKEHGIAPTLAVLRVGNAFAAVSYAHSIDHQFSACGMGFQMEALPESTTTEAVIERLAELDRTDNVHGILLQRPLPKSIDVKAIMAAMPLAKDVEGGSPINIGKLALDVGDYFPTSTPSAAMEILKYYEIPIEGKCAVVIGRSAILGKPMALLLMQANATTIVCHSQTRNLAELTRQADLLIAAAGRPKMITADMVAPQSIVIDFGVNVLKDEIVGDVDFENVKEIVSAITPVPGGTGPVTTMMLMRNTIHAAQHLAKQMGTRGIIRWLPTLKSPRQRK